MTEYCNKLLSGDQSHQKKRKKQSQYWYQPSIATVLVPLLLYCYCISTPSTLLILYWYPLYSIATVWCPLYYIATVLVPFYYIATVLVPFYYIATVLVPIILQLVLMVNTRGTRLWAILQVSLLVGHGQLSLWIYTSWKFGYLAKKKYRWHTFCCIELILKSMRRMQLAGYCYSSHWWY